MFGTEDFFNYGYGVGLATLGFGLLAGLSFWLKWGIRFRLVGVTGFLGVLTAGLFSLSLVPFQHAQIPGSVPYKLVYDTGSSQAVIVVSSTIQAPELEATLRQAASDLFSPGRMGRGDQQLTIRARTIIHPQLGVSNPLLLGLVQRSLSQRDDPNMQITLYSNNLAQLPRSQSS
jgi:Protein of function (DUF2518)